ncbi:MAG: hypothetical protein GW847_03160 [Zetaproteobacteria bacterium]|nr:hypothetical protein [Zetaproteobacteria bacterium]
MVKNIMHMNEITIIRENNFMINKRALKIYIDNEFIDYIEPKQKMKKVNIKNGSEFKVKLDWGSSNTIKIDKQNNQNLKFNVTSQIQNGLFILIFLSFFGSFILKFSGLINDHVAIGLVLPLSIIVFWQTIGRKNYLRLTQV